MTPPPRLITTSTFAVGTPWRPGRRAPGPVCAAYAAESLREEIALARRYTEEAAAAADRTSSDS
jgi:hypothetical protein